MSVQNISTLHPVILSTSEVPASESISDNRATKLWQKMAEKLLEKERSELLQSVKALPSSYLNWRQRPSKVQREITEAFDSLKEVYDNSHLQWNYFGDIKYELMGIKETQLIRQQIREAPTTQKEFFFVDYGAGDFQLSKSIANYLNTLKDIPKDVIFHIVGVRGENYTGEILTELGQCRIYNFGGFKIEELEDKFSKFGLSLKNKVDFAISRLCYCHLGDPFGTFGQAINLLRPKTGLFLCDDFRFEIATDISSRISDVEKRQAHMVRILNDLKMPFLMQRTKTDTGEYEFLVRRPDNLPCRLPLQYVEIVNNPSFYLMKYKRVPQESDKREINFSTSSRTVQGDRQLYDWLHKNSIFSKSYSFAPLYKDESTNSACIIS